VISRISGTCGSATGGSAARPTAGSGRDPEMLAYRVRWDRRTDAGRRVGNVKNNDASLVEPVPRDAY